MKTSREIKFRAWNTKVNKMIDLKAITPFALVKDFNVDGLFVPFTEELILMQYTGLKDKNGKEIYEGDILQALDVIVKVFFNESTASFDMEHLGGDCEPLVPQYGEWHSEQHEILGNIHQNPDLLTSSPH